MSKYTCHQSNNGQATRKSSYLAQDGHECDVVIRTTIIEQRRMVKIETDWNTEIADESGRVKNCGHIRSATDSECAGCPERRGNV